MARITKRVTDQEIGYVSDNLGKKTVSQIASELNRSRYSVYGIIHKYINNIADKPEKPVSEPVKGLEGYVPRELMKELYRRGYSGFLEFPEVIIHKIDISKL